MDAGAEGAGDVPAAEPEDAGMGGWVDVEASVGAVELVARTSSDECADVCTS